LRSLEPQVSEKLKTAAQKESKNVNQFVIETIKEKLGLRKNGTPIPTNNIWIAAIAFQNGLKLFTRDFHFTKIPGINLL
jgi:predicted nucleic acid-binding protein